MHKADLPTAGLHGTYRDVLRDAAGRITWDSGWRMNTIVVDCRRVLAAFMKGDAGTLGIQGILFGAGLASWDTVPQQPDPTDTHLQDPNPFLLPAASLQLKFMDPLSNAVSATPTKVIQIVATLGQGQPPWPEAGINPPHVDGTLREFGLVGMLDGARVLLNEVRHVAIPKDPLSTLVRSIQLVF